MHVIAMRNEEAISELCLTIMHSSEIASYLAMKGEVLN
jgi:hypothetical protein